MKGKEFTNNQKAEIYSRDRATCVFSGRSLWNLDYGACPLSLEWDWADHIKPRSRGGSADVQNGLCVSSTFNSKKRANGADSFRLLDDNLDNSEDCTPSSDHFYYFGSITKEWREQLYRLASIKPRDWFFNRALCHLVLACELSWSPQRGNKRNSKYYRDSALKKLRDFRKLEGSCETLEANGLVLHKGCEDVDLLLSMIAEQPPAQFDAKLWRLKVIYAANAKAMRDFWNALDIKNMRLQMKLAVKNSVITPAVKSAIQTHFEFWSSDPRNS
jgi:hypothetical protein